MNAKYGILSCMLSMLLSLSSAHDSAALYRGPDPSDASFPRKYMLAGHPVLYIPSISDLMQRNAVGSYRARDDGSGWFVIRYDADMDGENETTAFYRLFGLCKVPEGIETKKIVLDGEEGSRVFRITEYPCMYAIDPESGILGEEEDVIIDPDCRPNGNELPLEEYIDGIPGKNDFKPQERD